MSKHEPGPWKYVYVEPYCAEIQDSKGQRIKGVQIWLDDAPVPDYNAIVDANARLIAAAPSLYEALKALFEVIPHGRENWPELFKSLIPMHQRRRLDMMADAMIAAESAIAKAEGRDE